MTTQVIPITDRATWLELRRRDLTASDVAAVAGLDPRRSALSVYEEKIGAIDGLADNVMLRRGRWLEPAVLAALREMRPTWEVRPAAVYLRDPESRLGATPDAVAMIPDVGLANVQCKVVAAPEFEEHWGDGDGAPAQYAVQTTVETALMDAAIGVLAALVISTYGAELVVRTIERHAAAEARAHALAREFWGWVAEGVPPPVDLVKDHELIANLPASPGKEVDLSGDHELRELLEEREGCEALLKLNKADLAKIEDRIRLKLADAEIGFVPGWSLTWKEQTRAPSFVNASRSRVLRISRRPAR